MLRTVVCLKWGSKYSSEYVNRLYNMVKRNLSSFRFICFTDDPKGIATGIEVKGIPTKIPEITGRWLKLSLFQETLYDITGTLLYLDLNVVILNRLEPLFETQGNFCILQDGSLPKIGLNSSVMRFTIGKHVDIWNGFLQHHRRIMQRMPGDQEWLTERLNHPTFWSDDWCILYRTAKAWTNIPKQTKIVAFQGHPNPQEAISGYLDCPPAPWIANVWR